MKNEFDWETIIIVIFLIAFPILIVVLGNWLLVPLLDKYAEEIEMTVLGLFALYGVYSFMKGDR